MTSSAAPSDGDDHQRHAEHDEPHGVAHRLPEQRIGHQALVIVEPDEAQIVEIGERVNVEIGEAQQQRRERGKDEEQPDRGQRGRGHQPPGAGFGADGGQAHRASIQRRFSSKRSARRSISVTASSSVARPRTNSSATVCISVAMRSHSGTFGNAVVRSSWRAKASVIGSAASPTRVPDRSRRRQVPGQLLQPGLRSGGNQSGDQGPGRGRIAGGGKYHQAGSARGRPTGAVGSGERRGRPA